MAKKKKERGVDRQIPHAKAPTRKKGSRSRVATPVEKLSSKQASRRHRNRMTDSDKVFQKTRDKVNRDRRAGKAAVGKGKGRGKGRGKVVDISKNASKTKHQLVDHEGKTMSHDDYQGKLAKGLRFGLVGAGVQKFRYRKYAKTGPKSMHKEGTKEMKGVIGKGERDYKIAKGRMLFGYLGGRHQKNKYHPSKYNIVE